MFSNYGLIININMFEWKSVQILYIPIPDNFLSNGPVTFPKSLSFLTFYQPKYFNLNKLITFYFLINNWYLIIRFLLTTVHVSVYDSMYQGSMPPDIKWIHVYTRQVRFSLFFSSNHRPQWTLSIIWVQNTGG